MRQTYNHEGWKKKPFHDCLHEYPDYGVRTINKYAAKHKQLTHGCTISSDDYECMIDNGIWCTLFDKVSEMVGSRTIPQHDQDE